MDESLTPALVLRESPAAAEVDDLERQWRREFGGLSMAWDEAWLWPSGAGYATFEHGVRLPLPGTRFWVLKRVWIRRDLRRRGLVGAAWQLWSDRYGAFEVAAPNAAMQAFLTTRTARV